MKIKVLNIIGHPDKKSFNFSIHNVVKDTCKSNTDKFEYKYIDLHLDKFDPVIKLSESDQNKQLIESYKQRVAWADVIVITSPNWWGRTTTILEGFFDKILEPGFAFKYNKIGPFTYNKPLLKNKKVITFLTHDSSLLKNIISLNLVKRRLNSVYLHCFGSSKIIQHWSMRNKKEIDKSIILEKVKLQLNKLSK